MSDEVTDVLARADTIDIYSNPLIALWMREKAKRDPVAFCRLVQDNTDRLSRMRGKGEKTRWGDEPFSAWSIEELGVPFVALSGPRGTVFLVNYPGGERAFAADRKMGSAITGMLERLLLSLSGFSSSK